MGFQIISVIRRVITVFLPVEDRTVTGTYTQPHPQTSGQGETIPHRQARRPETARPAVKYVLRLIDRTATYIEVTVLGKHPRMQAGKPSRRG